MHPKLAGIAPRLRVPAVAAPMFLVSGPELVIAACKAGVIGAFPTLNARPVKTLDEWMRRITDELAAAEADKPGRIAPWSANLIVHRSNKRFAEDLDLVLKYRPEIVISALGSPRTIVDEIHDYGGLVFADVNSLEFAKKAADAGADGLVLVSSGAGGHTGFTTPFAFVPAVREFFDGPLIAAGGISDGAGIRAVQALGADLAYLGTRFIATRESLASDEYRQMLVDCDATDLITTPYFTGVPANYLKPSIRKAGIDPDTLTGKPDEINFDNPDMRGKAWKDIWSAGQGVGAIHRVTSVAELVDELVADFEKSGDSLLIRK